VVISADTAHREAADAGMEMAVRFANCSFTGFFIWSATIMSIQRRGGSDGAEKQ
jgi:hypothetical protein